MGSYSRQIIMILRTENIVKYYGKRSVVNSVSINVKQGQVVFFLAHQFHIVETSNVDGRCVITGNILYNPK